MWCTPPGPCGSFGCSSGPWPARTDECLRAGGFGGGGGGAGWGFASSSVAWKVKARGGLRNAFFGVILTRHLRKDLHFRFPDCC